MFTGVSTLGRKLRLVNSVTPKLENLGEPEIGRCTAQHMHLRCFSKGALDKVARSSSTHHEAVIMWGMSLECLRPLIHLLSTGFVLIGMPWTIACLHEIAVTYPFMVFTASLLHLVCRKSRICFRDVQMGFSPLSLH